jgi:putative membrane protein
MMRILLGWAVSATALYVVTQVLPGVNVSGWKAAFVAALVIGLVNATLGNLLKLLTLPIGCMTMGISGLVINALMFMLAANLISGFAVSGFWAAFFGSILMTGVNWAMDLLLASLLGKDEGRK